MVQRLNGKQSSYRLLMQYIVWMLRIDMRRVAGLFVIQLLGSLLTGMNVILVSRIANLAIGVYQQTDPLSALFFWLAVTLGLAAINNSLWPLFSLQEEKVRLELEESLLQDLQDKASRLRLEVFERSDFHDLLGRARSVTEPGFMLNISYDLFHMVRSAFNMFTISAVVLWWNPWLFFAIAITALPSPIMKWLEVQKLFQLEKEQIPDVRLRNYYAGIMRSREAAKEVRTFGLADWLHSRWQGLFWQVEDAKFRLSVRNNVKHVLLYSLGVVGVSCGIAWCVAAVLNGSLNEGRFAAMFVALGGVSAGIRSVFDSFSRVSGSLLRIGDFFDYMLLGPEEEPATTAKQPSEQASFVLEHVSFRYPQTDRDALQDVCCTFCDGERIALIGENGSGKTTLVKLLAGLYQPTEGVIRFGDTDLQLIDMAELRRRMAVVFQDFNRYAFTVRDNIGFGNVMELQHGGLIQDAAVRSGADEIIAGLPQGYDTLLTKQFSGGTELSGGQWQKLAIARSYMREAAIAMLDEPTSALDPKAESDVLRQFLATSQNKTAFIVSHRLGLARFCDRILLMQDGRIVEQGSHDELVAKNGEYAQLWAMQSQWYN
ncbi:ABC transporter ATP-binding protein [Paenibacillus sp. PR3]|uniref:ABC transporter ATP-binding protein n=1 Tax=Paenibacillus terricola TaxID=2763503 RepID=A0ABR8MV76_9BACL|nr:ABC transporter ATP-binding protein [Paenibacillus terricola]MBD3919862.1 ABC transporter ATP-binding protein [Paenibacillus terricola]